MNLNKKMKKFNDNLSSSSRTNSNKKIMIKTLNFDKLPKHFNSTNYNANTFLNVTKSKTHRTNNNHLPSSSSKIHSKPCLIKPISSRNNNKNNSKNNKSYFKQCKSPYNETNKTN